MKKQVIIPDKAPEAIGPYSAGIRAGGLMFTAGQLGMERESGELVKGGPAAEARQALLNLQNVLESGGASLDQVVKTTVFLRDINDYAAVNEVYADFFKAPFPARSAVQVAALPKNAALEIEAIAIF